MTTVRRQTVLGCRYAFIVALFILAAGCRTPSCVLLKAQVGPDWRLRLGQAVWQPPSGCTAIAGELLLATSPAGACYLEFSKTPLTLVVAVRDRERWCVQYSSAGRAFSGRGNPPARWTWLHLSRALAGETLPAEIKFTQTAAGDWQLENAKTGETMKGFFSP